MKLKALVTPALWPAPDFQDSVAPGGKWSISMSLSQWPALLGGSAIHSGHGNASLLQGPLQWVVCITALCGHETG